MRALAHGHELDKADADILVFCQRGERRDIVLIHAADEDGIDLRIRKTGFFCRAKTRQHVVQSPAPRDGGKARGIERVEADIQPVHARVFQLPRHGRKKPRVCGHGERLKPRQASQHPAQLQNPAPHERFSAREPELFDPAAHRRRGNLI